MFPEFKTIIKDRNGAGENIAWNYARSAEEAAAQAVYQWYKEVKG